MKKRRANKAKRFDSSCSNHGSCDYCKDNRLYQAKRELERTDQELRLNYLRTQAVARAAYGNAPFLDED